MLFTLPLIIFFIICVIELIGAIIVAYASLFNTNDKEPAIFFFGIPLVVLALGYPFPLPSAGYLIGGTLCYMLIGGLWSIIWWYIFLWRRSSQVKQRLKYYSGDIEKLYINSANLLTKKVDKYVLKHPETAAIIFNGLFWIISAPVTLSESLITNFIELCRQWMDSVRDSLSKF